MDVMTVLPSKRLETIRGVVSVPSSMGFAPGSSPFMDLGNQVEWASTDSVVFADQYQLDLVAFGQFRAPVFVAPMLGALQDRIGKPDHFLGFAGQFGDPLNQLILADVVSLFLFLRRQGSNDKNHRMVVIGRCCIPL